MTVWRHLGYDFKHVEWGVKEMFKSMDIDNSGTITFEELKAGLPKLGTKVSESEVRQLMEAVYLWEFSILQLWYHRYGEDT
ncbi:calcium-dependent protein kinase 15 isoform X5 [Glycine max]|uniref:calcium-dependent protein kinase 15 isoform X5 n=1 Tax=Glycine max TaxID=3847 RepID=UPI001B3576CE|nr:calcium-dependent protein kinase 15 isoform X5 [Glycine max]